MWPIPVARQAFPDVVVDRQTQDVRLAGLRAALLLLRTIAFGQQRLQNYLTHAYCVWRGRSITIVSSLTDLRHKADSAKSGALQVPGSIGGIGR